MRTIAYDGVTAVTTDEVADALLELAMTVARYSNYELVRLPIIADGSAEELTLMLGPTIHISARTESAIPDSEPRGAAEAVLRLRDQAKAITDPFHGVQAGAGALFGLKE